MDGTAPSKRCQLPGPDYPARTERRVAVIVLDLVEAVMLDTFEELGRPEPLKFTLAGCWSRRITQEHRLVYRVTGETGDFLQARCHYLAGAPPAPNAGESCANKSG